MYDLSFVQTLQYSIPLSSPENLFVYFTAEPFDIFTSPSPNALLVWSITCPTCEIELPSEGIEFKISCVLPNIESSLKLNAVDFDSSNIDDSLPHS